MSDVLSVGRPSALKLKSSDIGMNLLVAREITVGYILT